jgi:hypothetical protein
MTDRRCGLTSLLSLVAGRLFVAAGPFAGV